MPDLLILASGVGLVAATAALWVQGQRRADHRFLAGLISIAVTLSLFSVIAWAATAIAPLPLTWALVVDKSRGRRIRDQPQSAEAAALSERNGIGPHARLRYFDRGTERLRYSGH